MRYFSKSHIYIDLLNSEVYNRMLANPSRLVEYIPEEFTDWIIIDEIQRVPELLNEIHRLIEKKKYKFIMTGSSARKLRRSGHNLLGGRALTYYMYPLTALEMGKDFNLEKCLIYGALPAVFSEEDKDKYLSSYVKSYLEQEVIEEGISRNLGAFARFLETASFSQGSVLNMSEVVREAMVNRKVVEDYFAALEDLLLGVRLSVFSKKAKRRLISHNKFYFFDVGIYRSVRPMGPLDQPEGIGGIALESLFFQNLRAINDYLNLGYQLFYYRTASGLEVDFIAYGKKGLCAFEIKSKKNIHTSDLTNINAFKRDYPVAKCYILYGGSMRQHFGNIEVIPFRDALCLLPELLS